MLAPNGGQFSPDSGVPTMCVLLRREAGGEWEGAGSGAREEEEEGREREGDQVSPLRLVPGPSLSGEMASSGNSRPPLRAKTTHTGLSK